MDCDIYKCNFERNFDVLKMYGKLCRAGLTDKIRVEMARLAHLIVQLT